MKREYALKKIAEAMNPGETIKEKVMKYTVEIKDAKTGATSAIDTIEADASYTAEQYIKDCEANAGEKWCEMLKGGEVTLVQVKDEEEEEEMKMYTAARGSGDFIEEVESIEQGLAIIEQYEKDDEENDCYEWGFYDLEWGDHSRVEWLHDKNGEKVTVGDMICNGDGDYKVLDIRNGMAKVVEVEIDDEGFAEEIGDHWRKTASEVRKCEKM